MIPNVSFSLRSLAACIASVWLLFGCASTKGLEPAGHPAEISSLASDKSLHVNDARFAHTWPQADWWRAINDPQLDALMKEALASNPDLAIADARSRQARALAMQADAQRGASVSASGSVQAIRLPGSVLPGDSGDQSFNIKSLGLTAKYNADIWGGARAEWEAALGRQRAAEIDSHAARLVLSANVARTYAGLAHAYRSRDLASQDAERAQRLLELTRQRVGAGIDSGVQQRQAEAVAASSRQRLAQAENAIESQRVALAILLGKGPDRASEITRPAALQLPTLAVPDNLPADLLGRRPDIVAARWRAEAAGRDIAAAKSNFYPSFNLTAALGLVSFHTSDLLSLRNRYYAVAPAISLPIFDSGRLRANLAGRDADYDVAVAEYNKTLITAVNEVAQQVRNIQALERQASEQLQSADASRQAFDLAMQRYDRGVGSYVEALILQQSVLGAETALADIRAQQTDNAIQLVEALGGGFTAELQGVGAATSTKAGS